MPSLRSPLLLEDTSLREVVAWLSVLSLTPEIPMPYVTVSMNASKTIERLALAQLSGNVSNDPMLIIEQLEDEAIACYSTEGGINETLKEFIRRFVAARLED